MGPVSCSNSNSTNTTDSNGKPVKKKHTSFNTIAQQCIAIDDSPSQTGLSRSERLGDVNVYDGKDGNEALMGDDGYVHFFNALG